MLVRNKLCNRDCEGYLDGTSEPAKQIGAYEVVHAVRSHPDNSTDQSKRVADNEEPASPEDIRESAHNQEADTETQGIGESDPGNILRWANSSVNQCQRVGWQYPSQVSRDISET